MAQLKALYLSCLWRCVKSSSGALFLGYLTGTCIFTVSFFKIWTHKCKIYDCTVTGEIALYAQLETLYLCCLWGCIEIYNGNFFPGPLTGTLQMFRHFYCIICKIWTHTFGIYDNVIGEIALLAQLEAPCLSCLWGYVKSTTGTILPGHMTVAKQICWHFYCSILKIWTRKFNRYDNTVKWKIALLAQLEAPYLIFTV